MQINENVKITENIENIKNIKQKQYYSKWYQANKEKKKAQVKEYRKQCKDFIKLKQHQAYLRRKAEGYYG